MLVGAIHGPAVIRVMEARSESVCGECQGLIRPGDLIAKTAGWVHLSHVTDRLREQLLGELAQDVPALGGAAQEGTT